MTLEQIQALNESIWTTTAPSNGFPKGMTIEKRRLTLEEWADLQSWCATQSDLIYEMHNACMGFGCGMYVGQMRPSTFPGVPDDIQWIVFVTKEHLPLTGKKDRTSFEDGWVAFSPYTHSVQNAENLNAYGREAPKSKGFYDY